MNFMGYFSFIDFRMYGPFQLHLQGYFQIVSVNIYNVHVYQPFDLYRYYFEVPGNLNLFDVAAWQTI